MFKVLWYKLEWTTTDYKLYRVQFLNGVTVTFWHNEKTGAVV